MKKLISIVMAVILPLAMLSGCSSPRLSKSEYKKQVINLVDKYLCAFMTEDAMEEIMDLSDELDSFDRGILADMKEIVEDEFKNADKYLDQIAELNPPEEMEDFHEDLLEFVEKARDTEEKFLAPFDAKNEEKYWSASEKATSALKSLMKKLDKLIDDEEWLGDGLEDGDCIDSPFFVGMS